MKILKKIALSSLVATSLFASVETDAYIKYLLTQMYPNINKAPSIVVANSSQSVNLKDSNGTTIDFTLSDDKSIPTLKYFVTKNSDLCDITETSTSITVTKKEDATIEAGSLKEVKILLMAYDGELYSSSSEATVIFTNPESVEAPTVTIYDLDKTFDSDKDSLVRTLSLSTDVNNTLFVDINDTDSLKADILSNDKIQLTRLTADEKSVKVTVYATNESGLTESNSTTVELKSLTLPPYLAIASTATTYTSDTNWSVVIPYGTYSKTKGNVTLEEDGTSGLNIKAESTTTNDKTGSVTISGTLDEALAQDSSLVKEVSLKATLLGSEESTITKVKITIMNKNLAPTLSIDSPAEITLGTTISKIINFSANDKNTNDTLTVTATSSDENVATVSVDKVNSTIIIKTMPKVGEAIISLVVSDGKLSSSVETISIKTENTLSSLVENLRIVPIMNNSTEDNASIVSDYDMNITNASLTYDIENDSIVINDDIFDNVKLTYDSETATFNGNTEDKAIMFNAGYTYVYNSEEKTVRILQVMSTDTNKTNSWAVATEEEICSAGYSDEAISIIENTNANTITCTIK